MKPGRDCVGCFIDIVAGVFCLSVAAVLFAVAFTLFHLAR